MRRRQLLRVPRRISHVATVSVDATNITIPSSIEAGDIAVFVDYAAGGTTFSVTLEQPGWAKLQDEYYFDSAAGAAHLQLYVRTLSSSDGGTTLVGTDQSTFTGARRKIMEIFRPTVPVSNFNVLEQDLTYSTGVTDAINIGSAAYGPKAIAISTARARLTITGFTVSPTADVTTEQGALVVASNIFDGLSAPMDVAMSLNSNLNSVSCLILGLE